MSTATRRAPRALTGAPFEVERIGRHLGAEIKGLDMRQPLDQATFEALETAHFMSQQTPELVADRMTRFLEEAGC